jgi:hypothetical protein
MRIRAAVVFVALLVLGAVPTEAAGQATFEIGGPPTKRHLPFPPPQKKTFLPKATSEAIVIGTGFNTFGKVEIVGQGTKAGLCIFIDHLQKSSGQGTCGPVALPKVIATNSIVWQSETRRKRSLTELSGFMQPNVATVTVVAHLGKGRKRSRKAVAGIIAVPSPDLLARLHHTTPFGFFVADFRGCVTDAKVRIHAFDLNGLILGSSRVNLGFPKRFKPFDPCEPGSSTVGFVSAASARTAIAP